MYNPTNPETTYYVTYNNSNKCKLTNQKKKRNRTTSKLKWTYKEHNIIGSQPYLILARQEYGEVDNKINYLVCCMREIIFYFSTGNRLRRNAASRLVAGSIPDGSWIFPLI